MIFIPKAKKRKQTAWGNKEHQKIYQSRRWRKERDEYLSEHPKCKHPGCNNWATVVDHITPITRGGDIWNETNWQPLCRSCHNSKTSKENK